jgi:hypothetical protein
MLLVATSLSTDQDADLYAKMTTPGVCQGLWRPDKLIGRCFGLHKVSEEKGLQSIKKVSSPEACRAICCNIGEKCVSYQFDLTNKVCQVGGPVRLGFEGADTPSWCDPHEPNKWNGHKLQSRDSGKCTWGKEELPTQCFGLGAERVNSTKGRLDTAGCAKACCDDPTCEMWQEMPGRGCYHAPAKGIWCEGANLGPYTGARKCIKNFCGGKENEILPKYNAHLNQSKVATL